MTHGSVVALLQKLEMLGSRHPDSQKSYCLPSGADAFLQVDWLLAPSCRRPVTGSYAEQRANVHCFAESFASLPQETYP